MLDIIIPYFNNKKTIEKCLFHIKEQDFIKYNIFIVNDEKNNHSSKIIRKYIAQLNLNAEIIEYPENKGASFARNIGAKKGINPYLLFLDADCYLYPGMLRELTTQLDDNPDITFVYGNYRFIDKNNMEYVSKPFDPYLLETMNYISTMSIVRRDAFNKIDGFIETQRFFQDWSLFFRLTKAGYKGKWINEFIFGTNYPTEKSISGGGYNLESKCMRFKKEHDIKNKSLVVTTLGAPLQALQRAKILNADYAGPLLDTRNIIFPINLDFSCWKATYLVGLFNSTLDALQNHLSICTQKKIVHFIGTDVFDLITKHSMEELCFIKKLIEKEKIKIFANSSRLVEELKKCYIDAELLYSPIYNIDKYYIEDFPTEFTIGVYYSDENPMHSLNGAGGLSLQTIMLDIAKALPMIKFKLFGGAMKQIKDNVEYCGKIKEENMPGFINTCSMNLRLTIHDGFPQLPIQFLLSGRPALITTPDKELLFADHLSFEDIYKNKNNFNDVKNEIINKIIDIKRRTEKIETPEHKITTNIIKEYYKNLMNEEKYIKRIYEVINE